MSQSVSDLFPIIGELKEKDKMKKMYWCKSFLYL